MHSNAFSDNLRTVRDETVEMVMKNFFLEHPPIENKRTLTSKRRGHTLSKSKASQDLQCEEALMEAFGGQ